MQSIRYGREKKPLPRGRGFAGAKTGSDVPKGYAHPYYWAPFVLMELEIGTEPAYPALIAHFAHLI